MFRSRSSSVGDLKASMIQFRSFQHVRTFTNIHEVPTADRDSSQGEGVPREVDIDELKTDGDLEMLKKQDAFLYYSIPAVKQAEYLNRKIHASELCNSTGIRRNSNSCPARMMTESRHTRRSILRSTRISFECHDNLKLEYLAELAELVDDDETVVSVSEKDEVDNGDDDEDDDPMLNVFSSVDFS